ncbi:HAMP domain-containing sensor histidine kinase [Saccharopolyspora cebuensis]|uniref:histidine kinase n=1 Tax=Saccharopolyspora cebuensis TaxID=418759 RepID=A0ABV4CEC2_9PSEU
MRTLRGRLVLVLLVASTVGLLLMGTTSVVLLNRSLLARTDDRLAEMAHPWEEGRHPPPGPPPPAQDDGRELPTEFRVLFFDHAGQRIGGVLGRPEGEPGGPALPRSGPPGTTTVPDAAGGAAWRVRTVPLPDGRTIALALSLESNDAVLWQLMLIEVAVGTVVLALLAGAATVTVRLGLRPLTRIEDTADAIAAGDLQRRVPDQDPGTETGRLGAALNTMLGRLVDALRQRERSEDRMRRFVADASHELRTPLTSIRGFAELYRRSDEHRAEDVRSMMARIESEATRMGRLVEDLLLLARLDRGGTVVLGEVDLVALVDEVVQDARARAPEREIAVASPEGEPRVVGDAHRVHQVVANLVENALVHTSPSTPVAVSVSCGSAGGAAPLSAGSGPAPGTPVAVVSVVDRGPGVPAEHAERIFDRFHRADDGRSRGGTGLGLAIAAAIADAHGGRVELHPGPGGGSEFRLLLPRG